MKTSKMIPQYSTILFTDIWSSYEEFSTDFEASPFAAAISAKSAEILYYLLYARYGNNPIANRDVNQWKFKIASIIFQYGPTWEKKLAIQEELRGLSGDDLLKGTKAVYNQAYNPSTSPSTSSLDELTYINAQNTTNYKKSKMDAYTQLLLLLEEDVTASFIDRFKVCFKLFVAPERPLLYVTEEEEDE